MSAVGSIDEQIEEAKKKVSSKLSRNFAGYVAYFQSFTNTYVHNEEEWDSLKEKFNSAIMHPEILALSIATRPDCLNEKIINDLKELNSIKPVWIELGLQTIHENTAKLIGRGYETSVYDEAINRLHEAGMSVVTHVIAGLPGEDDEMIKDTVRYVVNHSSDAAGVRDGIKISLLYVLQNTRLAEMINNQTISIHEYSLEEYAYLLKQLLKLIPENIVVHRITGDPPKSLLISPKWTADKKRVMNYLKENVY